MSGPRLLLTRPRQDSLALAEELAGQGVESLIEPMMTIRIDDDARLDLSGAQAVLLTSANGARALAAASPDEEARRLPSPGGGLRHRAGRTERRLPFGDGS